MNFETPKKEPDKKNVCLYLTSLGRIRLLEQSRKHKMSINKYVEWLLEKEEN